jgi:hypothetical protein
MFILGHDVSSPHVGTNFNMEQCTKCFFKVIGTKAIHDKCVRDGYRWDHDMGADLPVDKKKLDLLRGWRPLRPGSEKICGFQKLHEVNMGLSKWMTNFPKNCTQECTGVDTSQFKVNGTPLALWKPDDTSANAESRNFENCSNCFMSKLTYKALKGQFGNDDEKVRQGLLRIFRGDSGWLRNQFTSCKACLKTASLVVLPEVLSYRKQLLISFL